MPSDAKKKRDAKKKEALKKRDQKKPPKTGDGEPDENHSSENGYDQTNGVAGASNGVDALCVKLEDVDLTAQNRSVTGVLSSHPDSRDLHIDNLSLLFHGVELLVDAMLELNVGRRYGLIGLNGCGKSSLLAALHNREVPIPDHIDIFLLRREMPPSDKTALEAVIEVDKERLRLEKEAEDLGHKDDVESQERLMAVYARLDELDASKAKAKAAYILHGLGFTKEMQNTKVKNFSGGWRMRIALARALYVRPSLLLLDEPTNHLDLNACVWLEEELKNYPRILVVISHSQDFLNGVCTNIIHMHLKGLKLYGGNFDSYVQTRIELEENQMKRYKWEQDQIAHMKNYIARFGHGSAKLARQAQSKEKTLKKMVDAGLTEKVTADKTLSFCFPSCGPLPPPVIMVQNVSFRYDETKPNIYKNLDFGIDLDTRIALVGPNGAGKSTLLKLISGELIPTDGLIRRHSHLKIGRYHQHLADQLDIGLSALEYMMKCYPDVKEREEMRKIIGRYGLTGQQQNYIARFGHGSAKLARQAQSKEKTLKKMVDAGLTEKVTADKTLSFCFPSCGPLPPPVIMVQNVSFRYDETKPNIYKNLDFGIDLDTRIALVGPNGAGKSTLLKLISGELIPTDGLIRRHSHLKIGRYHQHLADQLDIGLSALEYMMKCYPDVKEREEMRKIIGRYGLTGQQQICPIRNLSDGQRCRVTFAWLAWQCPHLLLLDEPTNHLDIETIDALADAINDFDGGMILVSHDFRLISQVTDEIWVCENQTITKWQGDIFSYKKQLTDETRKENAKFLK